MKIYKDKMKCRVQLVRRFEFIEGIVTPHTYYFPASDSEWIANNLEPNEIEMLTELLRQDSLIASDRSVINFYPNTTLALTDYIYPNNYSPNRRRVDIID